MSSRSLLKMLLRTDDDGLTVSTVGEIPLQAVHSGSLSSSARSPDVELDNPACCYSG